jgi:hypothetical protein
LTRASNCTRLGAFGFAAPALQLADRDRWIGWDAEQRRNPRVDLLVRAKHNRGITDEPLKLFEAVQQAPLQIKVQVNVPRQSARPKLSKKKARLKRPGRMAELDVRYQ